MWINKYNLPLKYTERQNPCDHLLCTEKVFDTTLHDKNSGDFRNKCFIQQAMTMATPIKENI